jgi:glycerophosphoryl diester phosphodiesterase
MLQLANARAKWGPETMTEVKGYATAIGPSKDDLTAEFVREAHTMGLQVVAYTYNAKNLAGKFPSVKAEIEHALYDLGVDGLFTDNPDMFVRRG